MTRFELYLNTLQRFGIQPGLERIRALLDALGQPQSQYPVVLIGGTNGKGSTCEFLANILADEGHKVGLYTSPHLYRWNERIRVLPAAGNMQTSSEHSLFPGAIADADLDQLFESALPHIEKVASTYGQPTEFETLTALGLCHFAWVPVDIAVVEVGLGGRWDATNVTEPAVSVITHVALDHCDRLGHTFEEIASDKVEISRPERILVTAETKASVLQVFQDYCLPRQVRLWSYLAPVWSNDGTALENALKLHSEAMPSNATSHQGGQPDFQSLNMNTATVARIALEQTIGWQHPLNNEGVTSLSVPGRAEVLRQEPLTIIDGANNPDGAERLAKYLDEKLAEGATPRRLVLVLGILADKDYAAMVQQLAPLAQVVIATQSHSPRASLADAVANESRKYCAHVESITPINAAVQRALQLSTPDDIVCVTGSFYTIAEVDRPVVAEWKTGAN